MKKFVKVFTLVIAVFALLAVASCAPKDGAAAKEKMDGKDYGTTLVTSATALGLVKDVLGYDLDCTFTASKQIEKDGEKTTIGLFAAQFKKSADAKAAEKSFADYAKSKGYESEVQRSGRWLYVGDNQAIKDFA